MKEDGYRPNIIFKCNSIIREIEIGGEITFAVKNKVITTRRPF